MKTIKAEFLQRRQKNPRYSLRAFARDIGLTPSQLSGLMSGKVGISRAKATLVAEKLALPEKDAKIFVLQAEKEYGRDKINREYALQTLLKLENELYFENLDPAHLEKFTDWKTFVIFEGIALFKNHPTKEQEKLIAHYFGFSLQQTRDILQCLETSQQIFNNGKSWIQTRPHIGFPDDIDSDNLGNLTRDFIMFARNSITERKPQERESGVIVMAVNKDQMREAKKLIRKFQSDFTKLMTQTAEEKDSVYCLSIQFFPVDKRSSKTYSDN